MTCTFLEKRVYIYIKCIYTPYKFVSLINIYIIFFLKCNYN